MCFAQQRRALFRHLNCQKVVRWWCVLYILTWKCASRIFASQRRVLFRHLNCQKWFAPLVFCTFWLGNVLRASSRHNGVHFAKSGPRMVLCAFSLRNVLHATTACNFSFLVWPAGSAPAALASLLFDPPEPQIIGKTQCLRLSYLSRICIFFLLTLSLLLFFLLIFLSSNSFSSTLLSSNLSLLSASSLLCVSSVHIVGSLTSKLPSIIDNIQQ